MRYLIFLLPILFWGCKAPDYPIKNHRNDIDPFADTKFEEFYK